MHVIDMQNTFMLPGVGFVEIKTAPEIVPNINRIAAAVRSAGPTVVWIAMTHTDDVAVNWSTYGALYTEEIDTRRSQALTKGTKGHEFIATLDVRPGEPGHREDPLLRARPGFQRAGRLPAGARHRYTADHRLPDRRGRRSIEVRDCARHRRRTARLLGGARQPRGHSGGMPARWTRRGRSPRHPEDVRSEPVSGHPVRSARLW